MSLTRLVYRTGIFAAYTVMLLPVLLLIVTSFFQDAIISFPPSGLTLSWYANALQREEFLNGFIVSFEVAALATLIGVPVGTAATSRLNKRSPPSCWDRSSCPASSLAPRCI